MGRKKRKRHIQISPATALRPRLDKLWGDKDLAHKDAATLNSEMVRITKNVDPRLVVGTMLRSYLAAPPEARTRLDEVLPTWLEEHDYLTLLEEMLADHEIEEDLREPALAWLEAQGIDTQAILGQIPNLFMKTFYFDDESVLGEKSQASAGIFWYTTPRKRRARGMSFLLDYNPPWDGSVKDIALFPPQNPDKLIDYYLGVWDIKRPEEVSAEKFKTIILTALHCNREAEIRLPRDLIIAQELFIEHVLSLPDGADTPDFTKADLEFLAKNGKTPEAIMHIEQTVGRRVRRKDGTELLIMADFDDLDDPWGYADDWDDDDWDDDMGDIV